MRSESPRVFLGLAAIAMAVAPVVYALATVERPLGPTVVLRLALWWPVFAAFTISYLELSIRALGPRGLLVRCAVLSGLGLAANAIMPMAIEGVALTGVLLAVSATMLARLSASLGRVLLVAQCAGLVAIYLVYWPIAIALAAGGAYAVLQALLYSVTRLADSERSRRVALEGAMRDLLSTRALLDEQARSDERLSIARDLHDVLGHHLVALGLQLDAAMAVVPAQTNLEHSRRLVRLLLADVRETVADLRSGTGVDLGAALRALASDGPGPRVLVEISPSAPRVEGDLANALLRGAQEAITNARKHARASAIRVGLDATRLAIADDGAGRGAAPEGSGLSGLRERCEALGCSLFIGAVPTGGTLVEIGLPGAEARDLERVA